MSEAAATDEQFQFKKTPTIIALILAIGLVVAGLVGAKITYDHVRLAPISMPDYPAPNATAPACATFLTALPDKVDGFDRVEIRDPKPAGAAAWALDTQTRITARCGVSLPYQYTALTQQKTIDGTTWMSIIDPTVGSDLVTYYATSRFPIVGVTGPKSKMHGDKALEQMSAALAKLDNKKAAFNPVPLSTIAAQPAAGDACEKFMAALPDKLSTKITYTRLTDAQVKAAGLTGPAAAWVAPGEEPVVVRCGVKNSPNFKAGQPLTKVNKVDWFEDTITSNGTTAGTWYSQGYSPTVAVSLPQAIGGGVIIDFSGAISDNLPKN